MTACEKCWNDAAIVAATSGGHQVHHYQRLLVERQEHPCRADDGTESPPEEAFWPDASGNMP